MRSLILYRNAFAISFAVLAICTSLLLCYFFVILPSDVANYHKLCQVNKQRSRGKTSKEQLSRGVQKDIWLAQEGKRLRHRLQSDTSRTTFSPRGNHYEVIEKMETINGEMQEKVSAAEETVRLFTADKGVYHYQTNELCADHIELTILNRATTGEETTLLKGTAEAMMLSLRERRPKIAVNGLKAILP